MEYADGIICTKIVEKGFKILNPNLKKSFSKTTMNYNYPIVHEHSVRQNLEIVFGQIKRVGGDREWGVVP